MGLDFPGVVVGEDLIFRAAAGFSDFSIAFKAVALAPSSADGASFFAGVVAPIERTFAFGAGVSPVIDSTLAFGGAAEADGASTEEPAGVDVLPDTSFPIGRLAMTGVCRGWDCWV